MAMMLGSYRTPGCCPGAREGRPGPDCRGGHRVGTRAVKRREQRAVAREVAAVCPRFRGLAKEEQ